MSSSLRGWGLFPRHMHMSVYTHLTHTHTLMDTHTLLEDGYCGFLLSARNPSPSRPQHHARHRLCAWRSCIGWKGTQACSLPNPVDQVTCHKHSHSSNPPPDFCPATLQGSGEALQCEAILPDARWRSMTEASAAVEMEAVV